MSDATKWEHQLFNGLTAPQRSWLSERVVFKTYPSKSIIFQPQEPTGQVYLVLSGKVKIEVTQGQKNWLISDVLSTGNWFGLHGLFSQKKRRVYARTLRSKTELAIFEVNDLLRLAEVNFDFAEKVGQLAAHKALTLEHRSLAITSQTAQNRLIHFVLDWAKKEGQLRGKDLYFDSQMTQEELGAYIGTGRQTVTEILTDLKAADLLSYNWGKFWVHDTEKLKAMSGR